MATYYGKDGMMVVGGTDVFEVENWSFTSTIDLVDVTSMGDAWEKHQEGGLIDFSGRCEGKAETATDYTAVVGTSVALQFEIDDSVNYFSGTGIITQLTEEWSVEDVGRLTYEFVGNDADGMAYT